MTLIANAANIVDANISGTPTFTVTLDKTNTKLAAKAAGAAAMDGNDLAYKVTGVTLDEQAKHAGTQELTVTGGLAEEIGSSDSASIVGELKGTMTMCGAASLRDIKREMIRV